MTTAPIVLFCLAASVPAQWQPVIRSEMARLGIYEAFTVEEGRSLESIEVEFAPLPGPVMGQAYCRCWQGHDRNAIVLDSTHMWTEPSLREVVGHEAFHVLLELHGHTGGLMSEYASGKPRLLLLEDQRWLLRNFPWYKPRSELAGVFN